MLMFLTQEDAILPMETFLDIYGIQQERNSSLWLKTIFALLFHKKSSLENAPHLAWEPWNFSHFPIIGNEKNR